MKEFLEVSVGLLHRPFTNTAWHYTCALVTESVLIREMILYQGLDYAACLEALCRHYAGVGGFIHFRDLAWCLQYRMYYMYSWLWQSKKINDPAEIIFGDKHDGIRSQFYREIGRKKRPAACLLCSNQ